MKKKQPGPIWPKKLQPGDTIGIVAPASHFEKDAFNRGVKAIKAMGFHVLLEDRVFLKHRYLAGTDQQRARHLNDMFENSDVDAIICARGGYGSMRILPYLDYETIGQNPKLFMGFSDISALLAVLYQKCAMVVFHGPTVTTLGKGNPETVRGLKRILFGSNPGIMETRHGKVIKKGAASGPVLCANLTTLSHLMGTPFFPDLDGHILMLEDLGEKPYRIDRMVSQLKLSGHFDKIAGLALGDFCNCGAEREINLIFQEITKDMKIPVLTGFQVGHQDINQIVPVGQKGVLDTDNKQLAFLSVFDS